MISTSAIVQVCTLSFLVSANFLCLIFVRPREKGSVWLTETMCKECTIITWWLLAVCAFIVPFADSGAEYLGEHPIALSSQQGISADFLHEECKDLSYERTTYSLCTVQLSFGWAGDVSSTEAIVCCSLVSNLLSESKLTWDIIRPVCLCDITCGHHAVWILKMQLNFDNDEKNRDWESVTIRCGFQKLYLVNPFEKLIKVYF